MTNEQAIIELRDLISDDKTDRENDALLLAIEKLREERPQGKWIEGYHDYFETLDCSLCGYVRNERYSEMNFCPNCGAKMKGGEEE